jgi:hypothetical protein
MATLDQLRAFFPTAESDSDVIKMASKQFGIDPVEIANEVGFSFNKPGLMSDVKRGTGQVISAIGSTARDLGLPNAGRAVENYGEDITYRNPSQINTVGEAIRNPLTTIRESVGEIVPQIGTSVGAGMAGRFVGGAIGSLAGPAGTVAGQAIGGAAGAYLGNLAQSYGGIRAEQREQGIEDKGRAFTAGAASAGLDTAFGAERVVNKFLTKGSDILAREAGTSLAKQVGKQTAIGFGTEALTETGQTGLERYGAYKPLTGDEALNEYGLAAIKGGIGGGVVRGALTSIAGERTPTGGNDIQQAFSQPEVSGTPINNVAPPVAPLVAPPSTVETSAPVAPAVTGGTTDIAQAQQQTQLDIQAAQIEEQKIQQAQAVQAQRDETAAYFGAVPAMENGKLVGGTIFGKSFADPEKFNAELDKLAQNEAPKTPVRRAVEKAYMDSLPPEKRKLAAIQSGALQFWANKPDIAAAAASINTAMSDLVAKGKGIDDPKVTQFAQMYETLTGSEAPAYEAATKVQPKPAKGAKNGQLPVQTITGLGAVPVEGGAGEANEGDAGAVQSGGVQSIESGSVPAGSLGLQVGQPSGEGIRTGTGGVSDVDGIDAPSQVTAKPSPETNQLLRQIFGDANEIQQTTNPTTSGPAIRAARASIRTFNEFEQAKEPAVVAATSEGVGGGRQYEIPTQYYNTDIMHISPERRGEIILQLFSDALTPQIETEAGLTAADRVEIVTLSLMEGMTSPAIAAELSTEERTVSAEAVQKQRERLGIKQTQWGLAIDQSKQTGRDFMASLMTAAENFKSPEFPDGMSAAEVGGLYSAKDLYYAKDKLYHSGVPVQEETEERSVNNDIKLQEELYKSQEGEEATQSAGEIKTAGGAQGNIDALKQSRKGVLDMGALDQINALEQEAETLRTAIEEMAPKDPRLSALEDRLEAIGDIDKGELGALWAQYAKAQAMRNKTDKARNVAVVNKEEETAAPAELTGEELAASEREDERRQDAEEKAKADQEGEKDAVQKSSAKKVPVREGAGDGKAVGKGNAQGGKAAGKTEAKQEAKPEEIKTPAEEWAEVSKLAPELPPYDVLKKDEKSRWDDLVRRGQANLAAAVKIIGEVTQPAGTALADNQTTAEGSDGTTAPVTNVWAGVKRKTKGDVEIVPTASLNGVAQRNKADINSPEYAALKASIAIDGIVDPIIITTNSLGNAEVFEGNHRLQAARELGLTEVPVVLHSRTNQSESFPVVGRKPSSVLPAVTDQIPAPNSTLFSKAKGTTESRNSVYNIWNTLYKLFDVIPADSAYKDYIRVSQTAQDAYEAAGKKVPLVQLQNAQAFIDPTDDRIVHLIADNIAKGSELAVLLHEVGVHVGLKKKLGANFKILEGQVKSWANASKGSLERQVYERAMARVAAARMDGAISADIAAEELVAYAAEEAALAGVKVKDAPRSRLEAWVKQLHDIASQAFKSFFKINNVPELSVQDLVNFSFAAAQEHMQAHRSEIGANARATESQIAKYYAGARGTYDGTSVVVNEDRPGPGEESFFWSPADKFGSFTEIGTRGFYSPARFRAPEYAAMVVTSAESRAFGDEQKNNQDKVLLTFQATRDPQTNIWSLIVSGPDIDSALYVDLYVEGLATTTKDNEGNEWSRLEGISGRDNLRLLGEFRRRLTRMNDGEIPNIDFVRVTGSGAAKEDGRPGVYAADTLATRFSKAPTADQVISALPKPLQASARSQWTNIKTLAKRGMYASAITEDVISMAKKYMPSAAKYLQAQYARQGTRLEFEKRIENILSRFDKLPENLKGEGKGSVNEYIHDSTREKKWGYYPGEQQIGTKLFEVDPDFKERFDKIEAQSPAAAQLIKDVFRHGYEALRLKQLAAENAVNREFDSRIKAAGNDADLLQSLNKEKRQMLKRITSLRNVNVSDPYAYLGRYGDYVVVAKSKEFIAYEEAATGTRSSARGDSIIGDPQQAKNWLQENVSNPLHYVVQFAETQGEADDIAAELQATGNYDVQPEDAGIKEANASYIGGSDVHLAVARLRNLAQRQSDSTEGRLDKAISDLYLMTVAEASARRSELERKNVSGADKNMMRNLATSGRADAHFLATMEHSDELNDALESMRDEARRNRKDAMPLYNELYTRYADSMEYSQPSVLAQNLLRMSTLWNLSTSPAYYLQQVLQTSVLSLPYMAGRLGYFRSARAIKRAYNDMSYLVAGLDINDHIDFDKAHPDVRFMLKELVRMGKIDIGIDADAKARTDEQGVLGKVMFKLQGVNTRIEAINRATAAIAAYRGYLERYKGATGGDAIRFAADVVSNTHGNYDGFNTPRILQSGGAKVLLQFKRFQIIQLSMLAKLIHTSFKGASAEERAVAFASLKFITAHMAVLGGALGVPFVSQAASILFGIFGDEDEPDDYEYKLRRMIGNDAVADLLLRGVPAAAGLESLGKRLSMENVASPFGPFVEFNLTSRADAAQMIVGMMGPAVGLGLKFVDALGMMSKGNYYKGLELALPNGIGNAMKSYRFATEGITMRNGDLVMKPEEISMIDAAFQAVGLPTTTITDRQYTQKVVAEFDKFYASRAGEIKSMYVEGSRASDPAAMAEARDDWQKLQESRVKNGYKRQSMSELFRAPVEARKRERGVVGGVETTKSNRRFVEQQVNQ